MTLKKRIERLENRHKPVTLVVFTQELENRSLYRLGETDALFTLDELHQYENQHPEYYCLVVVWTNQQEGGEPADWWEDV